MTQKRFPADWATSEILKQWCRNQRRQEIRSARAVQGIENSASTISSSRQRPQEDQPSIEDHSAHHPSESSCARRDEFVQGSSSGASPREPRTLRSSTRRPLGNHQEETPDGRNDQVEGAG